MLLLALLVVVPVALCVLVPIHLPTPALIAEHVVDWTRSPSQIVNDTGSLLRHPITDALVLQALAVAAWLLWAAFALCVATEILALLAGIQAPRLPGLGGIQAATSWLLTGTLAGLLASSALTTTSQAAPLPSSGTTAVTTVDAGEAATGVSSGGASISIALVKPGSAAGSTPTSTPARTPGSPGSTPESTDAKGGPQTGDSSTSPVTYVVHEGDWLGAVAHRFLGDAHAYDQIQELNSDLIPDKDGPQGPDHIEPGWQLLLPNHARDRRRENHATGHAAADLAPTTGARPSSTGPDGLDDSGGGAAPTSTPTPGSSIPSKTPNTPDTAASTPAAGPTTMSGGASSTSALDNNPAAQHAHDDPDHDHGGESEDGAQFGASWISWPLAASLAVVAGLVWMARRRRYLYTEPFLYPELDDDPDQDPAGEGDGEDGGVTAVADLGAGDTRYENPYIPGTIGAVDPDRYEYEYDADQAGGADEGEVTPLYWSIRRATRSRASDDENGDRTDERPGRGIARRGRHDGGVDRPAPGEDDEDLHPLPAALDRIRAMVQAHADALPQPQPPIGSASTPSLSALHDWAQRRQGQPEEQVEPGAGPAQGGTVGRLPFQQSQMPPSVEPGSGLPSVGPSGTQLAGLRDVPPEGLGLTGPGAADAARALLVAALAAGGPDDPDAAGIVVTTFDTLNVLIGGSAAVNVEGIPRLQIAADLDAALSMLDEHILSRRRTLDEHDESDVHRLREEQPWSAPMPPVLLLTQAPPVSAGPVRARLTTSLHLGADLQIGGVVIGDWSRGQTLHIDASGRVNSSAHTPGARSTGATRGESRLAIMHIADTVDLLTALGEAQTGEAITLSATPVTPPSSLSGPVPAVDPAAPVDPLKSTHPVGAELSPAGVESGLQEPGELKRRDQESGEQELSRFDVSPDIPTAAGPSAAPPTPTLATPFAQVGSLGPSGAPRIRLRVLGAPMVLDRDGHPVPGLRSGAVQILTILAVHRAGHPLKDIMEKMWPDAPVRRAADRLTTEATNLRRAVRIAMGRPDDKTQATNAVINTGSYYLLNPDLVDVDLWQLQDLINTAKDTNDPAARAQLLHAAIAAHAGPLADGRDYPWADVSRHQIQRHAIRARLHLAQLVAEHDPGQAASIISQAADADPVSEDLAQRAIRACAAAGDADAVRARLRTLRAALEEIDQEPTGETLALAANITIAKPRTRPVAGAPEPLSDVAPSAAGTGADDDTPGSHDQGKGRDHR